ncbi:hypothetical protein ACKKBG_A33125 [Auxenochlorella protothecoides x Auxenochlorella symbiontica]
MMGALGLHPTRPRTLQHGEAVRKDLLLLELDDPILDELLTDGLQIKGEQDGDAVLCTRDTTFVLKTVGTTNTIYLARDEQVPLGELTQNQTPCPPTPPGQTLGLATQREKDSAASARPPIKVTATVETHMELVPIAPRTHQLNALLQAAPYMGPEEEGDLRSTPAQGRCTLADLLSHVQMSEGELAAALAQRGALELDGRWCALHPSYADTALQLIFLCAGERGWDLGATLPRADMHAALEQSGMDPRVAGHCLERFGRAGVAGEDWALDPKEACRQEARRQLSERPTWSCGDFEASLRHALPESVPADLSCLGGIAVIDEASATLQYLPLDSLPADPAGRFGALFAMRPRWRLEELEPYLQGLADPGQSLEGLLLKYTRAIQAQPSCPVLYAAR